MRFPVTRYRARAIALAVAALLSAPATSRAQFSPGPLASVHGAWDKATACLECHEPNKATTAARCLACHKALGTRVSAARGYHGRDRKRATECASCHADHGGREAELVAWPGGRESFEHSLTGYQMEGRHAALGCRSCHIAALVRAGDVRAGRNLRLDVTYLGLSTRCAECHGDVHRDQFQAQVARGDCATCHTAYGWNSVTIDHEKTKFPLRGKHAQLECEKCHHAEAEGGVLVAAGTPNSFVRYHPLSHEACIDCHKDPHQNRYGTDCARCHSESGWRAIASGAFDHERTRYPLRGRHRSVTCEQCHKDASFKNPMAFARCADCHSDVHGGQFAAAASKGACDACHSLDAFAPARYGAAEHLRTRFPLTGAHAATPCAACHIPTAKDAPRGSLQFRLKAQVCADCHADRHGSQFASAASKGACDVCHTVDAFAPARYGAEEHQRTRFPLAGAHLAVACVACHVPTAKGAPKGSVQFRLKAQVCVDCHADEHGGQFASSREGLGCGRCHGDRSWHAVPFDHRKTRFALDGAHERAACAACHRTETIGGRRSVRYRPVETKCRGCHATASVPDRRTK